jgi:hypothetical protein
MQHVDNMMGTALPQANQMKATRARRLLQQVDTNFNVAIIHEI